MLANDMISYYMVDVEEVKVPRPVAIFITQVVISKRMRYPMTSKENCDKKVILLMMRGQGGSSH